jgi:uncharacterized protein (DUF1778 family)
MLATTKDLKDTRIEFKTSRDIKILLQSAANSLGMDLSSFLISTATQKAKEIIKEDNLLILSSNEWSNFQKNIATVKKPTKELQNLMNMEGFNA